MKAYKEYLTVQEPNRVILSDVPFYSGQRVEVIMFPADDNMSINIEELQSLFKATQRLPHLQMIGEEDIMAEIKAYRRGQ